MSNKALPNTPTEFTIDRERHLGTLIGLSDQFGNSLTIGLRQEHRRGQEV